MEIEIAESLGGKKNLSIWITLFCEFSLSLISFQKRINFF